MDRVLPNRPINDPIIRIAVDALTDHVDWISTLVDELHKGVQSTNGTQPFTTSEIGTRLCEIGDNLTGGAHTLAPLTTNTSDYSFNVECASPRHDLPQHVQDVIHEQLERLARLIHDTLAISRSHLPEVEHIASISFLGKHVRVGHDKTPTPYQLATGKAELLPKFILPTIEI